jgi:hypothetical protein
MRCWKGERKTVKLRRHPNDAAKRQANVEFPPLRICQNYKRFNLAFGMVRSAFE